MRGFSVDYGVKKDDPNKTKVHELVNVGDTVEQFQIGSDGLLHQYVVQRATKLDIIQCPIDPAVLFKHHYRRF